MDSAEKPELTRADLLLQESLGLLAPLIRLLIANGVSYPQFAQSLKNVFLDAARAELTEEGSRITDSALSLLSGVHRKDVRTLSDAAVAAEPQSRAVSLAAEVATRWATSPEYLDFDGKPRTLSLRARDDQTPSFERLAQSISKDFHARSLLDELVRLGVAVIDGDSVRLRYDTFVPQSGYAEAVYIFGANMRDHLAACERNLRAIGQGNKPKFLEHAVFADELTADSVAELEKLSLRLWISSFKKFAEMANARFAVDQGAPAAQRTMRVRFGGFFFSEDTGVAAVAAVPSTDGLKLPAAAADDDQVGEAE